MKIETPVLVVGGGPVGLALALELGWRGVECVLVDELERDGYKTHPRANLVNSRTMEFCRRWGIAGHVKEAGTPPDYPHTAMYVTSLGGHLIARIDRSTARSTGAAGRSHSLPSRRSAATRSGSTRCCASAPRLSLR